MAARFSFYTYMVFADLFHSVSGGFFPAANAILDDAAHHVSALIHREPQNPNPYTYFFIIG
jgi:hypothetical protein